MGKTERMIGDVRMGLVNLRREVREQAPQVAGALLRPKALEKAAEGATRSTQILAFFMLGPFIPVNLALIVAFQNLLAGIFGNPDTWGTVDATQQGMFGWLITLITLGAFIMSAYAWFQFVRTSGFGMFSPEDK